MPKNRALFGESNSVEQVLVRQWQQDEDIGNSQWIRAQLRRQHSEMQGDGGKMVVMRNGVCKWLKPETQPQPSSAL